MLSRSLHSYHIIINIQCLSTNYSLHSSCRDSAGILSIYNTPTTLNTSEMDGVYRVIQPVKSFKNLVTAISSVAINNDNTVAVYASGEKKDQIRIIHLPTMTVYSNWPSPKEGLNFIRDLSISGDNRKGICKKGDL